MDPAQTDRLLRGLLVAGDPSAETRAAATRILVPGVADAAASEQLAEIGLLTRYQHHKLKSGRIADLLFGPYLICEKIGEGGMGKVYRAVNIENGTNVALKIVRPHLMTNAVVQKRYAREAKAAASFDHPNIIKLLAEDTVEGRYYLAMEYIDGSDLSRMVREFGKPPERGLADPAEACEYIRQAALGLQHAHDRGFVHRDVKPSNLLAYGDRPLPGFDSLTGLKILDMGLVRRLMGADDELSRTELTRDGTVVGTPDYMSPEQAKNSSAVDGRADIYSLGCTLYFLLHGRPPFDGGSPIDKLLRHHTAPPPDPRAGRPDVSPGLAEVILKMMKKNPADRYQTAAEVAVALRPFCPGGAPAVPSFGSDGGFNFSLSPANQPTVNNPPATTTPEMSGAPPVRQLRLKVKQPATSPARVPTATSGVRDITPSDGNLPTARPRTPTTSPGDRSRRRVPAVPASARMDNTPVGPSSDRMRRSRRPTTRRTPVWPIVAAGITAIILVALIVYLLIRNMGGAA